MNERKEKVITDIKEVTERIEVKLSDYRTKFYKEMPVDSKKMIYKYLEKAVSETEILFFYSENGKFFSFSKIMNVSKEHNVTNICNYLKIVVNEAVKYYNSDFSFTVLDVIDTLKNKLIKSGYKIDNEFEYLTNRLKISNCITVCEEKYPELVKLKEVILIITDIDSIRPGTLTPEIHELYGIRTLLLELEEMIEIIENIEELACRNVVLEYIDNLIEWNNLKNIR